MQTLMSKKEDRLERFILSFPGIYQSISVDLLQVERRMSKRDQDEKKAES